mgnify:CR=1 FL=1
MHCIRQNNLFKVHEALTSDCLDFHSNENNFTNYQIFHSSYHLCHTKNEDLLWRFLHHPKLVNSHRKKRINYLQHLHEAYHFGMSHFVSKPERSIDDDVRLIELQYQGLLLYEKGVQEIEEDYQRWKESNESVDSIVQSTQYLDENSLHLYLFFLFLHENTQSTLSQQDADLLVETINSLSTVDWFTFINPAKLGTLCASLIESFPDIHTTLLPYASFLSNEYYFYTVIIHLFKSLIKAGHDEDNYRVITLGRGKRTGEQIAHFGGQCHHGAGLTPQGLEVIALPLQTLWR